MTARPPAHRIAGRDGARGRRRAQPPPRPTDDVRAVAIGTVAWGAAALVLLPFWDRLLETDRGWWVWTCVAGVGFGLLGVGYCRRKRRDAPTDPAQPQDATDPLPLLHDPLPLDTREAPPGRPHRT